MAEQVFCTICGTYHDNTIACGGTPTFTVPGAGDRPPSPQRVFHGISFDVAPLQPLERGAELSLWRTGTRINLNVYEGNRPVCQCHSAADAARIVAAINRSGEKDAE